MFIVGTFLVSGYISYLELPGWLLLVRVNDYFAIFSLLTVCFCNQYACSPFALSVRWISCSALRFELDRVD